MKLLHNRGVLVHLDIHDPSAYGYTHSQMGLQGGTPGTWRTTEQIVTEATDVVDATFNVGPEFRFYLALNLDNIENWYTPGSVANQNYLSITNQWYSDLEDLLGSVKNSALGSRIDGVRWDHEYRPPVWDRGTTWWNWAAGTNLSLKNSVYNSYLSEWENAMGSILSGSLLSYYFAINSPNLEPPWDGTNYLDVKHLYGSYFVPYQCMHQATMVKNVASIVSNVDANYKLIMYGANQGSVSPAIHGPEEYSLDWDLINKSNIVWELASAREEQSGTAWLNDNAYNAGSRPFFITLQQGTGYASEDPAGSYVQRRLDATNSNGDDPWDDSFGFWMNPNWNGTDNDPSLSREGTLLTNMRGVLNP